MCLWFKKKKKKSSQPTNICLLFFPVDPNFYSKNLLMLGKTYLAMKDKEKALLWLTKTKEYPAHTLEDKEVHTHPDSRLMIYSVFVYFSLTVYQWDYLT